MPFKIFNRIICEYKFKIFSFVHIFRSQFVCISFLLFTSHLSLLYNGYRVFSGGKERPRRDADPSPPSSAVVRKESSYTSTPPMGCTACTEPQCLYKGTLYILPLPFKSQAHLRVSKVLYEKINSSFSQRRRVVWCFAMWRPLSWGSNSELPKEKYNL